jgi:hydroxypyruvate isomerase
MKNLTRRSFMKTSSAVAATSLIAGGQMISGCTASEKEVISQPGKTPNTKFAVNVEIWWTNLPMADRIRKTAELGYPAIEFWSTEGKDLDEMRRLCDELNLTIAQFTAWGFKPGMNETANHDLLEQKIKEACEIAKKLNCKMATVVGGDDVVGLSKEEMHHNIIAGLKRVAPIAEEGGLMLILEPMNIRVDHVGHSLYGSPDAIRICQEVNSPNVRLNWDLYHMHITEGDITGRLREGFPWVGYLQLADHPGRNEPGTGEINYGRVLKEAKALGYNGLVGLECWPLEGEEKAAQRIWEADNWML